MFRKVLLLTFLIALNNAKIYVLDDSDLPKLKDMLREAGKSNSFRKLEEAASGSEHADDGAGDNQSEGSDQTGENEDEDDFTPVVCKYAKEFRPGFEMDGKKSMMGTTGLAECVKPQEYKVAREVVLGEDLKGCKGLKYTYTVDGEEKTTVLYALILEADENDKNAKDKPGYYSSSTKRAVVFDGDTETEYDESMGKASVFCYDA